MTALLKLQDSDLWNNAFPVCDRDCVMMGKGSSFSAKTIKDHSADAELTCSNATWNNNVDEFVNECLAGYDSDGNIRMRLGNNSLIIRSKFIDTLMISLYDHKGAEMDRDARCHYCNVMSHFCDFNVRKCFAAYSVVNKFVKTMLRINDHVVLNITFFEERKSDVIAFSIEYDGDIMCVGSAPVSEVVDKFHKLMNPSALPVTESYESVEFELADNQDKWQTILDNLAEYPDNWDDEGARAISPATIENCRHLLTATSKYKASLDDIFPTELGTVCIQWYNDATNSLVNTEIASDRMAFYADIPGGDLYDFKPAPYGKDSVDKLAQILETLV